MCGECVVALSESPCVIPWMQPWYRYCAGLLIMFFFSGGLCPELRPPPRVLACSLYIATMCGLLS